MYKKPYHIKNKKKNSIFEFISNKYIAYDKTPPTNNGVIDKILWYKNKNHKYPFFMEEAENLIELRNLKNNHFQSLQKKVKNSYLIRQENLQVDILNMIKKFNLKCRFINLPNYKKPTKYILDKKSFYFIHQNINNPIDLHIYNINKKKNKKQK